MATKTRSIHTKVIRHSLNMELAMNIITAGEATIGGLYETEKGRLLEVKQVAGGRVLVLCKETGHTVSVPLTYPLIPVQETFFRIERGEENTPTDIKCGKCGKTGQWGANGWLCSERRGKRKGHLIIRCPDHITGYAIRLIKKGS